MRVISLRLLREFWEKHADAERPLRSWFKTVRRAEWRSLKDVRSTYASADGVANRRGEILTVFNIGGNKYRLVARIRYEWRLINVRPIPRFSSPLNSSINGSSYTVALFQPVDFDFPFQWFEFHVAGDEFSFLFLG